MERFIPQRLTNFPWAGAISANTKLCMVYAPVTAVIVTPIETLIPSAAIPKE